LMHLWWWGKADDGQWIGWPSLLYTIYDQLDDDKCACVDDNNWLADRLIRVVKEEESNTISWGDSFETHRLKREGRMRQKIELKMEYTSKTIKPLLLGHPVWVELNDHFGRDDQLREIFSKIRLSSTISGHEGRRQPTRYQFICIYVPVRGVQRLASH